MRAIPSTAAEALVAAAILAPSSHNTQPWVFRHEGAVIELDADRTRALPVNDPFDRELTISGGAALMNLQVAAEGAGLSPDVWLRPNDGEDDQLAAVTLGAGTPTGVADLVDAIPVRRTHRGAFAGAPVPARLVRRLLGAAEEHGVTLAVVPGGVDRDLLAKLVAEGDRAQFADPSWRRELAAWMHPRRHGDGLAVPVAAGAAARFVVSHVDVGGRTAGKDEALTRVAPLVAVLATDGDDPVDWLTAGMALEHVLLVAAGAGLQAGYANQPCQVPELRPELRQLLGLPGHPQVVLRLGVPTTAPPGSARRPVGDVLTSITG